MNKFVLLLFLSLAFTLQGYVWAEEPTAEIVQIDWREQVIGKRVTEENGARQVKLHNGRTYVFSKGLLVEEIDVEDAPIRKNTYDFDNGIVIHELNHNENEQKKCARMITPFKDLPSERVEEMVSLSCFIIGDWLSLVSRGDTKNPFYHRYCKGRYDDSKL